MTHPPSEPAPSEPAPSDAGRSEPGPPGGDPAGAPSAVSGIGEGLAAAARRAGFRPASAEQPISGHALLAAMGGFRGIVEAVLPGLLFLVAYTITRDLLTALIAPVLIGLLFFGLRLLRKQTVTQALGGLAGIGISAALALLTGRAEDFYLPGFWTNAVYGAVLLVSALVGWPLIGVAVGYLMGEQLAWRSDPSKRRVLSILTVGWAGLFALRLAVQLPLYYSGNVEWLGAMKLLMGIPLYAPLLVLSWLMVRSVYAATAQPGRTPSSRS